MTTDCFGVHALILRLGYSIHSSIIHELMKSLYINGVLKLFSRATDDRSDQKAS